MKDFLFPLSDSNAFASFLGDAKNIYGLLLPYGRLKESCGF